MVTVQLYSPRYAGAFREINLAWISTMFIVEEHDRETLRDPSALIKAGGQIFIALDSPSPPSNKDEPQVDADDPTVLGVVALLKPCANGDPTGYEFAKMGVRENLRGRGVGRLLGEAALAYAREKGATLVDILSNRRLTAALALYKSLGFIELPMPPNDYERADIYLSLNMPPKLPCGCPADCNQTKPYKILFIHSNPFKKNVRKNSQRRGTNVPSPGEPKGGKEHWKKC